MKKIIILLCCFCTLSAFSQDQRRKLVDSLLVGISVQKDIRYNLEGRSLLLDIYHPNVQEGELLPCVVWIHGGALVDASLTKDYDLVRWGIARTVMRGYIGVSIDYRLITEKPLPAAIQDCETAIRFLKSNASQYGIDANRIAVVGESAGGYLAGFCTFACDTNTFTTGEWNGVSNRINCGVLWYPAIEHPPYSVIDYISTGDIPVLSVHGNNDHIVPIDKSNQLQKKCKEKGVDFQLHVIEGAGHGFFDDTTWKFDETYRKNMESAIDITISFIDRYLKNGESVK
jgi:acetyl esterase/lipase